MHLGTSHRLTDQLHQSSTLQQWNRTVYHQAKLSPHTLLVPGDPSAHSDSTAVILQGFFAGLVKIRPTNAFARTADLTPPSVYCAEAAVHPGVVGTRSSPVCH